MIKQYLSECSSLMETNFRPVVRDANPVYPAMVEFTMTTQEGDQQFLLGCNTDSGNFAIDFEGKRLVEFEYSANLSPEDLMEHFGAWLDSLKVVVIL